MNKLKTLKDIEKEKFKFDNATGKLSQEFMKKQYAEKIKQEAIKWIKVLDWNRPIGYKYKIKVLMDFFNITEEDLEGKRMRKIKFRAWDSARKIMNRVRDIRDMHLTNFNNWSLRLEDEKNNDVVVPGTFLKLMQSTGLKDKNGKEIYEGDIIEQTFYGDEVSKMLIKVKDIRFCMQDIHPGSSKENEVIGNIYENPELLEEKK